ncbi:M4 family metallopeptidase [Candidatus Protochlamydia sp. W-9]|uniref:M4 family metallopeptidase n=1 Tax=Candidatus Protochlamydia sp. W-9 TaxID=1785087 RepID=UPI00096AB8E7|nr:M4 family metallopeptidase [Candidatus Protochlamydia sp. W-9]
MNFSEFPFRQNYSSNPPQRTYSNPDSIEHIKSHYGIEWDYPEPNIKIYTMYYGREVCKNNQGATSIDPVAAKLYSTVKKVYEFFEDVFGLRGIEGQGTITDLYINWQEKNALWSCPTLNINEICRFNFNDNFAVIEEIVAHEYFHAVIYNKLNYQGQSGALNESLADVFGIAFKHWLIDEKNLQSPKTWWIGSLRDLSIPSKIPRNYKVTLNEHNFPIYVKENDYGYVHNNSCIPSYAFYLANQLEGGRTWGIIAQIWFKAAQDTTLKSDETFASFAHRTIRKASEFGMSRIIFQAWSDVGVLFTPQIPTMSS